MFYAHFVLSKKGPLAKVWLAAHWERKLTKAHVFETNIEETVDDILNPKVKLALRTSGHLLLGVVRIYSRKAKYLLQDCNDALGRIKLAFRPVSIDLPAEHRVATKTAITLAVTNKEMVPREYNMTEIDFDMDIDTFSDKELAARFAANQAHEDTITLKESIIGSVTVIKDDKLLLDFDDAGVDFSIDINPEDKVNSPMFWPRNSDGDRVLDDDRNGLDYNDLDEPMPAADDPPSELEMDVTKATDRPESLMLRDATITGEGPIVNGNLIPEEQDPVREPSVAPSLMSNVRPSVEPQAIGPGVAPVIKPVNERMRVKRKRKLLIDEQKTISSDQMRQQLVDTSDIVRALDMAPSTLKLMYIKENGSVEKMWNMPGYTGDDFEAPGFSNKLNEMFSERALMRAPDESEDGDDFFPASDDVGESTLGHHTALRTMHEFEDDLMDPAGFPNDQVLPDLGSIDLTNPMSPRRRDKNRRPEERTVAEEEQDQDDIAPQPDMEPFEEAGTRKRLKTTAKEGQSDDDELEEDAHPEDHDRMSRRTKVVFDQFATLLKRRHAPRHSNPDGSQSVNFKELVRGHSTRKEVAQRFYSTLVLKKLQAVDVEQAEPYGDIWIKKGGRFDQFDA